MLFPVLRIPFGHNWIPVVQLLNLSGRKPDVFPDLPWQNWLPHSLTIFKAFLPGNVYLNCGAKHGSSEHLLVFGLVVATLRIYVVGLQVRAIDTATNCGPCVSIAIGMESWPPKIGGKG